MRRSICDGTRCIEATAAPSHCHTCDCISSAITSSPASDCPEAAPGAASPNASRSRSSAAEPTRSGCVEEGGGECRAAREVSCPERRAGQPPARRGRTVDGPEHCDAIAMAADADSCCGGWAAASEASELWDAMTASTTGMPTSSCACDAEAGCREPPCPPAAASASSASPGSSVAAGAGPREGSWLGQAGLPAALRWCDAACAWDAAVGGLGPRCADAARSGMGLYKSDAACSQSKPSSCASSGSQSLASALSALLEGG